MSHLTEYKVEQLLLARKRVAGVLQWNVKRPEKSISLDIRRVDMPLNNDVLRLNGRLEATPFSTPGFVLEWHGQQIRGFDYAVHHSSFKHGQRQPERIRGWHEHLWTEVDRDKYVVKAKPRLGQQDFMSVLHWCLSKWRIDSDELPQRLGARQ